MRVSIKLRDAFGVALLNYDASIWPNRVLYGLGYTMNVCRKWFVSVPNALVGQILITLAIVTPTERNKNKLLQQLHSRYSFMLAAHQVLD